MKVLFTPYFEANEYQNLLMESVADDRIRPIKGTSTGPFALTRHYVSNERFDVAHLLWTHPFFIMGSTAESDIVNTIRKGLSFVCAFVFLIDVLILKLFGVGLVWTVHNKHNHERHHVRLDRAVSTVLAIFVDLITVECTTAKDIVVDLFRVSDPSKIYVVPEGNYVSAYPNEVDRESARKRIEIDPKHHLFVFFGQIRPYKGVPDLIDAFEGLDYSDARLLIVGNPAIEGIEAELRRKIDNVDDVSAVFKFIPNGQVQLYMNAADVVVLPYRDILTSGSVLLAMSFGRAVVAPESGCIPSLIDDESGFLYRQDDPNGLENALRDAYKAGDQVQVMGERNYRLATQLHWEEIGERTVAIYDRSLQRGKTDSSEPSIRSPLE